MIAGITQAEPRAEHEEARAQPRVETHLLLHSTWLNVLGQIVPLGLGAAALPVVVHGLGVEQFGLLSVAWAILAYFTVFDLGLAPATTKFVAEALARGDKHETVELVSAGLTAQAGLGLIGSLLFYASIPILISRILNVSAGLQVETSMMFGWLAVALPIVLLSSSLSAVLQGLHRFDLVNIVRVPSATSTYLAPALGIYLGMPLSGIAMLIAASRFLGLVALAVMCLRVLPGLKHPTLRVTAAHRLFRFGLWQTATNVAGTFLWNSDRFLIAALLSAAAVGYYTVPAEVMTRLAILPSSLVMALFPAFSALEGVQDWRRLQSLFARSVKFSILVFGPPMLLPAIFASEFLHLWMGADFAEQSAILMRVLTISSLVSFFAYIPLNLLKGIGHPDVAAKCTTVELFVYAAVAVALTSMLGVTGTAIAWCLRAILDAALMFYFALTLARIPQRTFWIDASVLQSLAAIIALACVAFVIRLAAPDIPNWLEGLALVTAFGAFGWFAWMQLLDSVDRHLVLELRTIMSSRLAPLRRGLGR